MHKEAEGHPAATHSRFDIQDLGGMLVLAVMCALTGWPAAVAARHECQDSLLFSAAGDAAVDVAAGDALGDALLTVSDVDGSSLLRTHGVDDAAAVPPPVLAVIGVPPPASSPLDDALLNVLLAVNGLDHSLLALSRVDDTLLAGVSGGRPPGCGVHRCRQQCSRHGCPGGYCDRADRCRCFC